MNGSKRSPRRSLHPDFVEKIRGHRSPIYQLGRLAGWAHGRELSYLTQPQTIVVATGLTVTRLQVLANVIGYAGEIFLEERTEAHA